MILGPRNSSQPGVHHSSLKPTSFGALLGRQISSRGLDRSGGSYLESTGTFVSALLAQVGKRRKLHPIILLSLVFMTTPGCTPSDGTLGRWGVGVTREAEGWMGRWWERPFFSLLACGRGSSVESFACRCRVVALRTFSRAPPPWAGRCTTRRRRRAVVEGKRRARLRRKQRQG